MPNHVTNVVKISGKQADIDRIMGYVQAKDEAYGSFDFNKIIPMPASMNIESGSSQNTALEVYFSAINPATEDMGIEKVSVETLADYIQKTKKGGIFTSRNLDVNLSYEEVLKRSREFFNGDKRFREETDSYVKDDIFLFGKTILDNMETYGCADWYSWSNRYWNTKWNAYDYMEQDPGSNELRFNTAWAPPHPVIQRMSEMFPEVSIHHEWADEDVGNNCGYADYQAGDGEPCYKDGQPDADRFALEVMGYDLDEFYEAENGSMYNIACDMPNTVSKEKMEELMSNGLSLHGFKRKIKYDEAEEVWRISDMDDEDCRKFLKRLEKIKADLNSFFYD